MPLSAYTYTLLFQIFTVRSGGATGVVVRGPDESGYSTFEIDEAGSPISIKYSHQHEYLGIQRSKTAIVRCVVLIHEKLVC